MTIVTVSKLDKSSKGKPRVYFNGRHSYDDAVYVSQKLGEAPRLHSVINANMTSKTFDDGKTIYFLNDFKYEAQQPAQAPGDAQGGYPSSQNSNGVPAANQPKPKGWAIDYGDLSRFVSNVVGSAIAANRIEKPSDMAPWIASAYRALEAVREGKILDFDDDPREIAPELPDPAEPQGYEEGDPGIQSDEDINW
jgi:hypothetical protein